MSTNRKRPNVRVVTNVGETLAEARRRQHADRVALIATATRRAVK